MVEQKERKRVIERYGVYAWVDARERERVREGISFKQKKKQTKYMLSLLTASVVLGKQ